jgi:hypothetical protein
MKVSLDGKFTWRRARAYSVVLVIACLTGAEFSASARDLATSIEIGKHEIGAAPAQFDLSQGQWTVVRDATAETGIAIQQTGARTTVDRTSLAVYTAASLKNAELSIRLNAAGGKSDQGGGIAVRLSSPQNYYLVQVDALRERVVFSLVNNDVPEEIVGVDADIASHAWHTLAVRAMDTEFVVSLDGIWMFTGFDKTLSKAGRIALWTKGDSLTRFDQIEIAPLP